MTIEQNLVKKLRSSNLRPTKQRIEICKVLFDRERTFHFTISDLAKILNLNSKNKISLATIYNTVEILKSKGHLKEISINSDKTFFDTNISNHHHFFNENTNELTDFYDEDISRIKIKKNIPGKKVKSIEVLVKIANSN
tara:strand:- start:41 stop:457 length:417 start_codon:yes stop_codon:yes gene_type:complete